ncbi:MAG: IS110 family transposase, partial [Janthinobacterium lividum]
QRTMLINALRSHLAELGVISAQGPAGLQSAIASLHEMQDQWPELACDALHGMVDQLRELRLQIEKLETRLHAWHRKDKTSCRLAKVPGIGPITASAIVAAVPDASIFRSGRQFAAWLGLTPKAHSSGGKEKLGGISKQGDGYIRRLLVVGATSVIRVARKETSSKLWATKLLERKPARVVSVALANKTARIVWAMLARGEDYAVQAPAVAA